MTGERAAPQQPGRRRPRRGILVVLVLVGLVGGVLGGVFPFRQMFAHHRQVDAAEQQLADLLAGNQQLEQDIATLRSSTELERIAREQFGLVRPGEVGYTVEPLPGAAEQSVIPEVVEVPDEEVSDSWWQDVWDFLTGRDLEPDG
ncbi:MAG: septum formation initiator family protein [Actinomycetota bacterium]|nr:septum formation initiator family protein [Actinomycetota bacterium]